MVTFTFFVHIQVAIKPLSNRVQMAVRYDISDAMRVSTDFHCFNVRTSDEGEIFVVRWILTD